MGPPVYLAYSQEELDRAYDQREWAANAADVIARYGGASAAIRDSHEHHAGLAYGPGEDERLDWFPSAAVGAPVHVHIHGGAWRSLSRADVSFGAPPFVDAGVAYVTPDFTNLPEGTIPGMVEQLVRAMSFVHRNAAHLGADPDRIFLSGHSSGAHLCAVLLTRDWTQEGLPADLLKGGLCISGMYDLEPVMLSSRRSYVTLAAHEQVELSPALHASSISCPVAIAYGGRESPEFVRQAKGFADALSGAGRPAKLICLPDSNHFEIAEDLGRAGSDLSETALAQIAAHDRRVTSSKQPALKDTTMARLRHFAVCVRDLEKSATFYEGVFDLKRVGREDLPIGSALYLSDGVVNLALLKFHGADGNDLSDPRNAVGSNHFGFQVDDLADMQRRIEAAGGKFFFDLGDEKQGNFERKFKDPDGVIFDISKHGWLGTDSRTEA